MAAINCHFVSVILDLQKAIGTCFNLAARLAALNAYIFTVLLLLLLLLLF